MGLAPGSLDATLAWSEGAKMWAINEKDEWVRAMRELSLPLGAGPSGTTNMLMNVCSILGGDPTGTRLACIGYLLPIHAHSLVEVLAAAASHGVGFTAGQQMYRNIAPFPEDVLRSRCGIQPANAEGRPRFPDEPPATAART
jgi:hypothetical protein